MSKKLLCGDDRDDYRDGNTSAQMVVFSFGFGHGPAPSADMVFDLRDWFADPHGSAHLRRMTGRDHQVIASVLSAPGAVVFVDGVFTITAGLVGLNQGAVTVAVGCAGGRHRAPVVADQLAFRGRSAGWIVEVFHRDIDLPVLDRRR